MLASLSRQVSQQFQITTLLLLESGFVRLENFKNLIPSTENALLGGLGAQSARLFPAAGR